MTSEQLKARSKQFALAIIALIEKLPHTLAAQIIARQMVRSASSVGANYRVACRARSRAEFAAKVAIAVKEADETLYWLELVEESGLLREKPVRVLICEAGELVAILAASYKSASASRATKTRS